MNTSTLFTILGWSLAAAGVALFAWAMFWDRAATRGFRRRVVRLRRCPKCWYDMTGAPGSGLRCPECGKEAKSERKLFKTKRRWRWAALGALCLFAARPVGALPAVRANGAEALIPDLALAALAPLPKGWREAGSAEAAWLWKTWRSRQQSDRTSALGERLMLRRFMNRYPDEAARVVRTRPVWPEGAPIWIEADPPWWMIGMNSRRLLAHAAHTPSTQVNWSAGGAGWAFQLGDASWLDMQREIPAPSSGSTSLSLLLSLEQTHRDRYMNAVEAMTLWAGGRSVPIQIVASVDEIMTPVQSEEIAGLLRTELHPSLRVEVTDRTALLDLSGLFVDATQPLGKCLARLGRPTVGVCVEVLRDGVCVARGEAGWTAMAPEFRFSRLFVTGDSNLMPLRPASDALFEPGVGESEWRILLRSDAHVALRDLESETYWQGEVVIPLWSCERAWSPGTDDPAAIERAEQEYEQVEFAVDLKSPKGAAP